MHGDEYMMPGVILDAPDERADFYLEEVGPGKYDPLTFTLTVVTGNATFSVIKCTPDGILSLAGWLHEIATAVKEASTRGGPAT